MQGIQALTFIYEMDYGVAKLAHELLNSSGDFLTFILKMITYLGNGGVGFIVAGVILLLFKKTRIVGFTALVALLFGSIITNIALKNIVARPRPFVDETSDFYLWWLQAGSLRATSYSFPSGHATAAAAFSVTFFIFYKKKYSWLYLFIPLVMGFTRVYFNVHFASDVIAGIVVGSLASIGAYYTVKGLQKFEFIQQGLALPSITVLLRKDKSAEGGPKVEDK